jgi:DNA-binding NarL/FixJ family response regulator
MAIETARDIRVLLVDGHVLLRDALRLLIDSQDGLTVVGQSSDRANTLRLAQTTHPDVILLDLDFGQDNVFDFLPQLRAAANGSRLLILTGFQDEDAHRQVIRLGAHGIVKKDKAAASLLKAIRKVYEGELWIDRSMTADLIGSLHASSNGKVQDPEHQKIEALTNREREVVTLIAQGLKNKEIGQRLFISDNTVRHHVTAIFSKLHVNDRVSLVVFAGRHGLTSTT